MPSDRTLTPVALALLQIDQQASVLLYALLQNKPIASLVEKTLVDLLTEADQDLRKADRRLDLEV